MAITRLGPNQDITAAKIAGTINFKNLIINGDMSIAQRGTSTSGVNSNGYYSVDRMRTLTNIGTFTVSQSTDTPTGQGFSSSFKYDCTTAEAISAVDERMIFEHRIEGQNVQQLKYGTSSAESLTLSFWVKSNKTGTYCLEFFNQDNNRQTTQLYTINSASTWEKKTITISGDTSQGFTNDNNFSLGIFWWLASGTDYTSGTRQTTWSDRVNANRAVGQTVNLADNTANEWYITGVQLEADTSASDFEFLPYDVNLQRCYRYFYNWISGHIYGNICMGRAINSSNARGVFQLPARMRTAPSLTANGNFRAVADVSVEGDGSGVTMARSATDTVYITFSYSGSMTTGQCAEMGANNDVDAEILFDAEL